MTPTDAFEPADRRRAGDVTVHRSQGRRRVWLRPPVYRALRSAHIATSVAWLGIVLGKLVLELGVLTAASGRRAESLFTAATAITRAFPPLVFATLVTGVLLGLGTRWGLLRYYWVVTKLALSLAVVVTAVTLVEGLARSAMPSSTDELDPGATVLTAPAELLAWLTGAYVAMLLVATVVSVYKPWGRVRWRQGNL
ncbi:hypothetical protein [Pseudonocardia acaciae]|uniref:hypothetical protein n=1 Tax=Pseudonocardia acaciae TaxID=551276 RepID=UPI000490A982|nr:hypothetical protein [Pseudonocardia acaciae]